MLVTLAASIQIVTSVPPDRIDLTLSKPCASPQPTNNEVVVCGRRLDEPSPYRINQPATVSPGVPKAEVQLFEGVNASAETENYDVGGRPSKRAMVRLKIRF
jgi:hypothetical protein